MPFNFYGLYVPTECSSNDIEMAEDDHVPDMHGFDRGYRSCSVRDHGKRRDFE